MDRLTVLRPGRNLGYGAAHNLAFKLSEGGRYHAVLNTDLVYGPDVFPRLLEFMDAHNEVGLSMPRVIYPDGSIQHLCRLLPHPLDIFGGDFCRTPNGLKSATIAMNSGAGPMTASRNSRFYPGVS